MRKSVASWMPDAVERWLGRKGFHYVATATDGTREYQHWHAGTPPLFLAGGVIRDTRRGR